MLMNARAYQVGIPLRFREPLYHLQSLVCDYKTLYSLYPIMYYSQMPCLRSNDLDVKTVSLTVCVHHQREIYSLITQHMPIREKTTMCSPHASNQECNSGNYQTRPNLKRLQRELRQLCFSS